MTQQEKAKAYDEAIERAKYYQKENGSAVISAIFPELKESEDEKIRKGIKSILEHYKESGEVVCPYPFVSIDEALAWLEKQGRCDIDCPQKYQDCSRPKTSNENIKNCIGMCLTDANEQRFKDYNTTLKDCLDWFEKQGEQKLAYIVEPKFKVGDWITNGRYTKLIVGINSNLPNYMFEDGTSKRIKDIDKNYHLWNIKDAKDGDILVTDDNRPFKFKGLLDKNHPSCPVAYYGIDLNLKLCMSNDNCWWTNHDVYPATKKQCDFLFDKLMNIQTNEY